MADTFNVNQARDGNIEEGAKRRPRRPKSGNSDLFNDLLSQCNQLSVAERTRLVKSLAGQLGLLTVGGQTLIDKPASAGPSKKEKAQDAKQPDVRPNPLKGTKFWTDKEAAKAAMLKAREDGGGAQLAQNHPAVTAYAVALKAYKDEQAKLKPVEAKLPQGVNASKKQTAKRRADKSPERGAGVVTRARSVVKRLTGSQSMRSEDQMEDS